MTPHPRRYGTGAVFAVVLLTLAAVAGAQAPPGPDATGLLRDALAAAREIQAPAARASALAEIARGLILTGESQTATEVLAEACRCVDDVQDEEAQGRLLDQMLPVLEGAQLGDQLVALAQQARSPLVRARLLAAVAREMALRTGRRLLLGTPVRATCGPNERQLRFSFDARAGLPYAVQTGDLQGVDTALQVLGPDGAAVAQNDDISEDDYASRAVFTAAQDGLYTILLNDYNDERGEGAQWSCRLSVDLYFGPGTQKLDCQWPAAGQWQGTLTGEAGAAQVVYVVEQPGAALEVTATTADGQALGALQVPAAGRALTFQPAQAGPVTVVVRGAGGEAGACTIYAVNAGKAASILLLAPGEPDQGPDVRAPGDEAPKSAARELADLLDSVGADYRLLAGDDLASLRALAPAAKALLVAPLASPRRGEETSANGSLDALEPVFSALVQRGGTLVLCSPGGEVTWGNGASLRQTDGEMWGLGQRTEAAEAQALPPLPLILVPSTTVPAEADGLEPLVVGPQREMIVGVSPRGPGRVVYLGFTQGWMTPVVRALTLWALGLDADAAAAARTAAAPEVLAPGDALPVAFPADALVVAFAADLEAGRRYVAATSDLENCDTVIQVTAPDGSVVGEQDDRGDEDRSSELSFTAEKAGRYLILVTNIDEERTGSCLLSLTVE